MAEQSKINNIGKLFYKDYYKEVDFDNLLYDIHLCALKKLISINTDESKYSVDFYKRAFPLDGCRSHNVEDIE